MERKPRLGPTLNEIDLNQLQPELKLLNKEDIDVFTQQVQRKIDQINEQLSIGEKESILTEASKEDPIGYQCEKQILNITEVSFVEHVNCYTTTEEVCSLVSSNYLLHQDVGSPDARLSFARLMLARLRLNDGAKLWVSQKWGFYKISCKLLLV